MSALPWIAEIGRRVDGAFERFRAALPDGPALCARTPASPWSPLDVAEHVALTNRYLFVLVRKRVETAARRARRGERPPDGPSDCAALERIAASGFRWESPAHMLPTGRAQIAGVLAELAEQRARAAGWLAALPRGEGRLASVRMTILGPEARLDPYQLLAFAALHLERHARQVERIRAAAPDGPPAS